MATWRAWLQFSPAYFSPKWAELSLTKRHDPFRDEMAAGEENGEEMVRLQSSEGETFEVSLKVAKVSRTLATMLEG